MECPACHKLQTEIGEICEHCGLIFSKWLEIQRRELKQQSSQPVRSKPSPPVPETPRQPILEITSSELSSFKVLPILRTTFGLLLTAVDPLSIWLQQVLDGHVQLSSYSILSLFCLTAGIWIGILANKQHYSDILTAGGAGMVAGLLRSGLLYVVTIGNFTDKMRISLPTLAIYCFFTLSGGIIACLYRNFFTQK